MLIRTLRNTLVLLTSVVLSPLLFVQAMYTRAKASGLPEPVGKRSGVRGQGSPISVLILGDSAAAGVGVDTQDEALSGQLVDVLALKHQVAWSLSAQTGHTTKGCLNYLAAGSTLKMVNCDYIVISLGVNDVTSGVSITRWIKQCAELMDYLLINFSPLKIYWSELPPMDKFIAMPQPLRWIVGYRRNMLARALEQWMNTQDRVELLRLPALLANNHQLDDWIASDGFHPGVKMYTLWGRIAAEQILSDNQMQYITTQG